MLFKQFTYRLASSLHNIQAKQRVHQYAEDDEGKGARFGRRVGHPRGSRASNPRGCTGGGGGEGKRDNGGTDERQVRSKSTPR